MKKATVLTIASVILLGLAADVLAGDVLGYPVVEKQLRFYSIILGIIAVSAALVTASCFCSRLFEAKKKADQPAKRESFDGLAAAAHSAK